MKYEVYSNLKNSQRGGDDLVIIPEDKVYHFFEYNDDSEYMLDNYLTAEYAENPNSSVFELMNYYIRLENGTQLFFRKEKNMWKWLYEHHDDFRVDSYGEYH